MGRARDRVEVVDGTPLEMDGAVCFPRDEYAKLQAVVAQLQRMTRRLNYTDAMMVLHTPAERRAWEAGHNDLADQLSLAVGQFKHISHRYLDVTQL